MEQFNIRKKNRKSRPIKVTYLFLAIQIIVFILMTFNGGSENIYTLIYYGAKFNPFIVEGEVWRLFTPMFLHIGFMHILLNSITLYYLGSQIELIYGSFRFALIYILGGLMGNVMSFAFSDAISAGASTSLFGLFAATIVLGKLYPNNYAYRDMAQSFTILIIINFISGLASSSVDNWGHLGGAIGGALGAMFVMVPNYTAVKKGTRFKMGLAYMVLFILLFVIGYTRVA